MKKILSLLCISVLSVNLLGGCSSEPIKEGNKQSINNKLSIDNEKIDPFSIDPFYFNLEDTSINGKPITQKTYKDITNEYGQYKEIKYYKTPLPATPDMFHSWALGIYEEGQFLFIVNENEKVKDNSQVEKFFITGDKCSLKCGLKVGMSVTEVMNKFKKIKTFNLDTNDIYLELNVLNRHMPKNYYSEYKDYIYIDGAVTDKENEKYELGGMTRSLGIVLLIKEEKVAGIVMDHPVAN
jgi:hypothetical protein